MKSKYVESYWVQEYESGIFILMFNTTKKWIPFHRYSNTQYEFGEQPKKETAEEWKDRVQDIEEFLPKGISYLPTVFQEKDQISFYFIPYDLISRKKIKYENNIYGEYTKPISSDIWNRRD